MSVNEMAVNEMSLCLHTKWLLKAVDEMPIGKLENMALD